MQKNVTKFSIWDLGVAETHRCVWRERAGLPATDPAGAFLMPIPREDSACALGTPRARGANLRVRREPRARRDIHAIAPSSFAALLCSYAGRRLPSILGL